MNNKSPVSTAAASGGVVGAVAIILVWAIGLLHITVPAEVATAFLMVLTPAVHLVVVRMGIDPDTGTPIAVVPVTTITQPPAPIAPAQPGVTP